MPFSDTMPVTAQINVLLETNSGSIPVTGVSISDINALTDEWSTVNQTRDVIAAYACCCSCWYRYAEPENIGSRRIL